MLAYYVYYMHADNPDDGKTLLGTLDYAWLFSYAVAMFFRYANIVQHLTVCPTWLFLLLINPNPHLAFG